MLLFCVLKKVNFIIWCNNDSRSKGTIRVPMTTWKFEMATRNLPSSSESFAATKLLMILNLQAIHCGSSLFLTVKNAGFTFPVIISRSQNRFHKKLNLFTKKTLYDKPVKSVLNKKNFEKNSTYCCCFFIRFI